MININNINKIKSLISKHGITKSINILVDGKNTIRQIYINNPSEFLNHFNDLKPIQKDNKIYYTDKNGLTLFYYYPNDKNKFVYIDYYKIWLFFEMVIELKSYETQNIIKNWLEQTYNLKGLTPDWEY